MRILDGSVRYVFSHLGLNLGKGRDGIKAN
jgi:hypothetical protein